MNDIELNFGEVDGFYKLLGEKVRSFYRHNKPDETEARLCLHGVLQQTSLLAIYNPASHKFGRIPLSSTYMVFGESLMLQYFHGLGKYHYVNKVDLNQQLLASNLERLTPHTYSVYSWIKLVHAHHWLIALTDQHEHAVASVNKLRNRKFVSKPKLKTLMSVRDGLAFLVSCVRAHISEL